jgi:asparagine N-glycosylation enzyme membrane subunit Stt3
MTAEEHNKTLATLHFIYGAIHGLTLVGLVILLLVVVLATPAGSTISAFWIVEGSIVVATLFVVVGLLPLLVGYGFRRRSRWVKPAGIVLAVLSLINIPIGTALGIYTIKFLRSPGGVKLYGGSASSATEGELKEAMDGAQPLVSLADKWK